MLGLRSVFRTKGPVDLPMALLIALVAGLLVMNALLHDPYSGYDANDHVRYVQALAANWQLPGRSVTGQYYAPPLPYVLPAMLTSLHVGLWKALKVAQLFNAVVALALLFYGLKICEFISPQSTRTKLVFLIMLGMLPVFYRSFALIRGEPYLAFLAVYITYRSLLIFVRREFTPTNIAALGIGLGLAILTRQWAFFLFPPIFLFAVLMNFRRPASLLHAAGIATGIFLIAFLVGGWFYLLLLRHYGTLMAFDRLPQPLSTERIAANFRMDVSALNVFWDPVRPTLAGSLIPISYADTWGDYWGAFLVYARDTRTGQFEDGIIFQNVISAAQFPEVLVTNRFTIKRYLGAANLFAILPSAIFLGAFLYGFAQIVAVAQLRATTDAQRAASLLGLECAVAICGYGWFLLRYQTAGQAGDLAKSTYALLVFPLLALLGAIVVDRTCERRPRLCRAAMAGLGAVFVLMMPALVSRYARAGTGPVSTVFIICWSVLAAGLLFILLIRDRQRLDAILHRLRPRR